MEITVLDRGQVRVIRLCRRIDIHNVFDVEEELLSAVDEQHTRIMMDFQNVEYFGSNGIRTVMLAKKKLDQMGGRMVLVNLDNFVRKILQAVDLLDVFDLADSEEDAIQRLLAPG